MSTDVDQLLTADPAGVWVSLDVLLEALQIRDRSRAYRIVRQESIRTTPGRPRQYNLNDIARVWRARRTP